MSKTIPQEAGKSKTVPQEGRKIWGPPVRPLQANHTSGKGEIPKPYLRKGGTEVSSPPEVWFEYLEVRRKYLKNPGGMKTIPQLGGVNGRARVGADGRGWNPGPPKTPKSKKNTKHQSQRQKAKGKENTLTRQARKRGGGYLAGRCSAPPRPP